MIELFVEGGYMMWVIALATLLVFGFAAHSARDIFSTRFEDVPAPPAIDAVLFWGAFALAAGFLGTAVGLMIAARAIERAGEVSTAVAWSGLRVTLVTTIFGLVTFCTALLLWFVLWYAHRRRTLNAA